MRAPFAWLALLSVVLAGACTTYEYEEEVFLGVDGSGRIRVSGSKEILPLLHGVEEASVEALRRHFGRGDVELVSVRETARRGRSFLHVQMRFSDWNRLCASPAFRVRNCGLRIGDDEIALDFALPAALGPPDEVAPNGTLAVRFHLPSRVRYHNSPSGIERGNILSWERTLEEHFARDNLPSGTIEVRFGRRSVLAATARILLLAAGIVVASVAAGIYWMVRKGRRELASEAAAAARD